MSNASIPEGAISRCWKGETSIVSGLKLLIVSIFLFVWTLQIWGLPITMPISIPIPISIPLQAGALWNDHVVARVPVATTCIMDVNVVEFSYPAEGEEEENGHEHEHKADAYTESEDCHTIANENTCTAPALIGNINTEDNGNVDDCDHDEVEDEDDASNSVIPLEVLIPLTSVPYIVWHIVRYVSLQLYLGN